MQVRQGLGRRSRVHNEDTGKSNVQASEYVSGLNFPLFLFPGLHELGTQKSKINLHI